MEFTTVTTSLSLDEMDFFKVPENRLSIFKREAQHCFYCLRKIDVGSYVVEHVISRPKGHNSYRNFGDRMPSMQQQKGRYRSREFPALHIAIAFSMYRISRADCHMSIASERENLSRS